MPLLTVAVAAALAAGPIDPSEHLARSPASTSGFAAAASDTAAARAAAAAGVPAPLTIAPAIPTSAPAVPSAIPAAGDNAAPPNLPGAADAPVPAAGLDPATAEWLAAQQAAAAAAAAAGAVPPAAGAAPAPASAANSTAAGAAVAPAAVYSLVAEYFPPGEVGNALAVSRCESSFRSVVSAPNSNGSRDWGLFQLNDGGTLQGALRAIGVPAATTSEATAAALDERVNVAAAAWIWSQRGWQPWTCAAKTGIVASTYSSVRGPSYGTYTFTPG